MKRRRAGFAVLGACALVVLLACLLRGAPAGTPASPPPPPMPGPRQTTATAPDPTSPALAPLPGKKEPPPSPERPAPVIDEISVEKPEVCEGEENLISIRAHTVDGTDEFLHYTIAGTPGQRVPLRAWRADDGEKPPLEVRVFGRDNVATTAKVPPFVVKPCKPPRSALVTAHLRANTWSEFDLEVKVVEAPEDGGYGWNAFRAKSYEWAFGDGQTAVTDVPYTTHNYEGRRQDTMFTNVLVEVKIRGNAEEPVVGRTTLQLLNPTYEDLAYKGVVSLMVQLTPRFPELGSDGVVRQKVRLWHNRDKPVFIHSALVYKHNSDPQAPVAPNSVDPSGLLGTTVIPPGHGIEFETRLDAHQTPDLFSVEYHLEGKDSEGLPVRGGFSVMRPPQRPTKENSAPVVDPLFKAKILAARRILNQQYVTDEDLWRLERQGQFAALEAQFKANPPQRPPVDPRDAQKDPGPPPAGPTAPNGAEGSAPDGTPKPQPQQRR